MKYLYIILLIISMISCNVKSQETNLISENSISSVMKFHSDSIIINTSLNSLSIGIVKDGNVYSGHYGELDNGKGNTPTDKTIYEIASVTKSFTGVLVAQAILENKLNLEDDIRDYLKEKYPNLAYNGSPIKIKHLLSHTGGLPRFIPVRINDLFDTINEDLPFKIYNINKQYTRKQFLSDLHLITMDTIPGSVYQYSNADAELTAHILENVYEATYMDLIQKYITNKANMIDTKLFLNKEEESRLATGYGSTLKKTPYFSNTLWGSGGGLKSSISDLTKYIKFQLDENNPAVVESHKLIYSDDNIEIGYSMPIYNDEIDGLNYGIHGGAYGTQNWIAIIPKHNLGISIITNQSGPETAGQLLGLMNVILDDIR